MTPQEALFGSKPSINHFPQFHCLRENEFLHPSAYVKLLHSQTTTQIPFNNVPDDENRDLQAFEPPIHPSHLQYHSIYNS